MPTTATKTIRMQDPNIGSDGLLIVEIKNRAGSPLLMHRFSKKVEGQIAAKQTGKALGTRPPKDFEQEYLESMHVIGARPKTEEEAQKATYGIPAVAFKNAIIRAATLNQMKMTEGRMVCFVLEDAQGLVKIKTSGPKMDVRYVRISKKTADLRSRGIFEDWSATLRIEFNAKAITPQQLLALVSTAGRNVGLLEMRPSGVSSSGDSGRFEIVSAKAVVPEFVSDDGTMVVAEEPARQKARSKAAAA